MKVRAGATAVGAKRKQRNTEILSYHLMLLPGMLFLFLFSTVPLFGLVMAFQKYVPAKGFFRSKFVGLDNFRFMFQLPDVSQVVINTLVIALSKIVLNIIVPVVFALLLNEVKNKHFKRVVQTVTYMPYFLSWVILGGIFVSMFSMDGLFNNLIRAMGGEPIMFMASNKWFRPIIVLTDTWKGFGYNAIDYLAALTAIDYSLYEAAAIDGANRWQQMTHITMPALVPTVILLTCLSLGNLFNANFDQIFNMYNPLVYKSGDIIDTYIYRMGLVDMQFSLGTAVGLLKSFISFILIGASYYLAKRFAGYRIF
mgnify:FL=1